MRCLVLQGGGPHSASGGRAITTSGRGWYNASMTRAGKAVSLLAVSLLVGCTSPPPAENVLFVSFDTSRADRFTAYGYRAQTTPTVTALAQRGVLFERAYSHVPSTLPAHSSMFTGLLPPSHGVRCNGKYRLADERLTLAEILAAEGFDTAAIIGAFPLAARFGLAQGFDHYDDDFSSSALTARYRRRPADSSGSWIGHSFADFERGGDEVTDRALGWLSERDERWFLFVHYFDPHWPYAAPAEYAGRFSSPYDAELAFADNELSRLLAAVQKMPGRTLVVFTSDHGEGLGDHGEALHNRYLYDSTQHVPLVMALEGALPAGAVVGQAVGHVDLLPSVLELLGVAVPAGLDGRSLLPLARGESQEPRPVYMETLVPTLERPMGIELRAVVDGGFKFIETRRQRGGGRTVTGELYDLGADPAELADMRYAHEEIAARLRGVLGRASGELEKNAVAPEPLPMDEGTRQRLKALGYL